MTEECIDGSDLSVTAPADSIIIVKLHDEEECGPRKEVMEGIEERSSVLQEEVKEAAAPVRKTRRKANLPVRSKDHFLAQGLSLSKTVERNSHARVSDKVLNSQYDEGDPFSEDGIVEEYSSAMRTPNSNKNGGRTATRSKRTRRTQCQRVLQNSHLTMKNIHDVEGEKEKNSAPENTEKMSLSKDSSHGDGRMNAQFSIDDTRNENKIPEVIMLMRQHIGEELSHSSDKLTHEYGGLLDKGGVETISVERLSQSTKIESDERQENDEKLSSQSQSDVSSRKSTCQKRSVNQVNRVNQGKITCEWCQQNFRTIRQRNTHNRIEHTEKKAYPCGFCPRSFTESSHCKRHLRSHTGERPFSCEICGKEFVDNSYIRRHMLIHKGLKPYQCDQCGKMFREKTHLSRHEETHKREQDVCEKCNKTLYGDKNRCACKDRAKSVKTDVKKKFCCEQCGKGFTKEGNFQRHVREHEKSGLPQDSVFTCDVCQKEFGLERHLLRHKRIHTGEKPFQCKECGKQFRDNSYITRHMRIHAGHKPFQCDLCNKTFRENGHLARHMLTHTGEKKFNCSTCGKGYQDKVCLLRHESMCVISTIKPDAKVSELCDICGKEYLGKGSLRRHRLMHSGQKAHHCTLCPAQFYDTSSLRRHISIHSRDPATINQCSHCSRVFRTRRALNLHSMTHEEILPTQIDKYECKLCNCEFPSHTALTLHAAAHPGQLLPVDSEVMEEQQIVLGIDSLECKLCNKLFATQQNLTNHELTHTQSLLADNLTSTAITVTSSSQEISTEVLMPSALLESSVAANADDFEGLFKLLQVIAQANQNQTVGQTSGNLVEVPTTVDVSGIDVDSQTHMVTVVSAGDADPSISDLIGQTVAVTPEVLESTHQLGEEVSMDAIGQMEFSVQVDDPSVGGNGESSDSELESSFHCDHCGYECRREKCFAAHMANVHPGIVFARQLPLEKAEEVDRVLQWQCPFCNDVFEAEKELRDHTCVGLKDKPFKCARCDMSFPRKAALTQHLKIHESEPKYRCSFCSKTFHFKNSLTYHERIHTQEKPFKCTTCVKSFKDKSHLRRHEKIHQGVKPYSCQICPKTFLERSQLVKHIRVHSGEKPYLCAKCGKSFADASHLRRHSALHETVRERKHQCLDCPKAFRTNDSLRSHRKIHIKDKAFVCDICNKAFSDGTLLKRHKRCHREEKPYSCQICSKLFRERCQLVKHFRVHTGDKPYACKLCEKRFADTPQRKRHVMTAHAGSSSTEEHLSELSFCYVCGEAFTELALLRLHMQDHRTGANAEVPPVM